MSPTKQASTGLVSYLSLFTSFGTLLCCALPSLLVLFGLGATVASFLSSVPWLVTMSRHKNWVFLVAGLLIGGNFLYIYALAPRLQTPARGCPVDTPSACTAANRTSRAVLWISAVIYGIGVFSAYVLGPLLMRFGQ
jgi:mercuric ion transport protein